ncbi:MAG: heparan-alpha-glucosaminide N-acetyltransferase domain-containing protein [Myxococcales bacterium]
MKAYKSASLDPYPAVSYTLGHGARSREQAVNGRAMVGRVMVVDLLRLVATAQMVQGHTVDAVLSDAYRAGPIHDGWLWLRGLTSVAFLFVAGLSFHLATLRALPRHLSRPGAAAARFRRAGTLILTGYALHFPLPALFTDDPVARSAALTEAVIADVLQCIGLTLALLELLAVWLRDARRVAWVSGALGVALLGVAPLVSTLDPAGPLRPLLNYVTPAGGSIFPLVPWAAHMLIGAALAPWLLSGRRSARFLAVAGGLLALGWGAESAGVAPWAVHLSRLGWVSLGCAGLDGASEAGRRLPSWVLGLAGETLVIYVLHIVLAYGQGVGLADQVGRRLGPWAASGLAVAMLLTSAGAAVLYRRMASGLAARTATG